MNEKGSNHQLLKRNNANLIKKYIYQHSPISRVEVAQALSLTTPTITGMVTPLLNRDGTPVITPIPNSYDE